MRTIREAAYRNVAAALRARIDSATFGPDRRLPTEAELSREFRVSRQTVRHAFAVLVAEGLVYRVPGRGSFAVVSPNTEKYLRSLGTVDDLLALAEDTVLEVVEPFASVVDVAAAGRLRLETDNVARGVFQRLHHGEPFSITTTYLPPYLADQIRRDRRIAAVGATSSATIMSLLEESAATDLAGAHQSISAAIADAATADLIGCAAGDAVLTIDRIFFDRRGRFVELAIGTFNPRRYSYRLELRRSAR